MNPPLKKLSVLFLIGAIVTSSLALGVSAFVNRGAVKNDTPQQANTGNASSGYKIYGAGPNGQNLTDEVANIYARRLVEANPQGPQQNQDGSVQLLNPTSTELFSYLATNVPSPDILTPPVDESKVHVIQNFDISDVSHYLSEVTQIQDSIASNPVWQAGLSATTTTTATPSVTLASETGKVFAAAQNRMYALEVPAPFVSVQKSLIAFISTMASFSNVAAQDPVAAMALSKNLDMIVAKQSADIEKYVKDVQTNFPKLFSAIPRENRSGLAAIFGILTAHAQIPVTDLAHIGTTIGEWAQWFWREYKQIIISTALGVLKNFLIQKLSQKVIAWAQGAGVPGYVTNWILYEADVGLSAKFGLVNRDAAKACGNAATGGLYGDILASALGSPTYAVGVYGVSDALDCPPLSSGFYNTGGYSPENFLNSLTYNTYNDILDLRDNSIRAAGAASQAAVNEALSGRGSLDVKKCDDGTPMDNEGLCGDGSPARTITPGSAKQDLLSKVLSGAQDIITSVNNENTYSAIVAALTQAVVTYVIQQGQGVFSNSSTGGTPPPPPAPDSSTVAQQLIWYSDQLETSLSLAQGAIANSTQALGTFQTILDTKGCAGAVNLQVGAYMRQLTSLNATLDTRVQEIQGLLSAVQQLQQDPAATQAQLDAIASTDDITAIFTRSKADYDLTMDALNAANDLLLNCGPSIPVLPPDPSSTSTATSTQP